MINPKRRKVGDLCFLKLDGYQPPWRQAVIVKEGKGAKFILVVRMLDQEIEDKTEEISFFAMGGEKFLLVEGKANQLRSTCLNPHRALEVEGQKLVAFTRTKLADEDLHYVTASEDLAEDSSKRKTHSMGESSGSEGPESSEEDDKVLEMLVRAQKLERGKGIVSEDRAQSSKEKPKRYPMLQGKTGEKEDTGINFEQMLLQSLASKGSEPAKTDQHLQTLLTLEVLKTLKGKKGRNSSLDSAPRDEDSDVLSTSSDEDKASGRKRGAGKAMRDFRESHKAMRRKPLKHVKKYIKEIEEIMGVSGEVGYNISDYTRKIQWGKQKSLMRIHYAVSELLQCQLKGKQEQAALQAVQLLRAIHQSCLDGGSWRAASLLMQHADPLDRPRFGGEAAQLEDIATYLKAIQDLEKRSGGQGEDPDTDPAKNRKGGKGKKQETPAEM